MVESLYHLAVGWKGTKPDLGAICFWLKNRRPSEWRDVQNIQADHAHYIVADRPMTEQEWIEAREKTAILRTGETFRTSKPTTLTTS